MTDVDPRELPNYNGPELDGLSPDEKHELRKQLRIMARQKRVGAKHQTSGW